MRHSKFARALTTVLVLAALAACGSRAKPPPAAPPAPQGALAQPRGPAQACTRDGDSCKAPGAECCPGLICTGSASGICITRQ